MTPQLLACLTVAHLLGVQGDEVRVGATLSRQDVRVGDTVVLTVTVRAPGQERAEIRDPEFDGLSLLGTSDRSEFRLSTGGRSVREISRDYALEVERAGRLVIPPITVTVAGVAYETARLALDASGPTGGAVLPEDLRGPVGTDVGVRLWVEPETVYVGQQITMTAAAMFDPEIRSRLQRQPEYRAPEVQGFWTAELPSADEPDRRTLAGREYFVQVFRRALFPLAPGSVRIPSASVVYEVRRGLLHSPETFQVESEPVTVVVRALPEEGRPPAFTGAVGDEYEAEAWLDRSRLRAGEAVNLTLEIRGTGNLSALGRPPLPELERVRSYQGTESAEVQVEGDRFGGRKRFSWVLVPEGPGHLVVPGLRVGYFDPSSANYRIVSTGPMTLAVEPPGASLAGADGSASRALRFVKPELGSEPLELWRRELFWMVQTVPAVLVVVGFLVGGVRARRRRRPGRWRRRPARALGDLRDLAESGDAAFFAELRGAILSWLQERLERPDLAQRGVAEIQHALEDAGVPPSVAFDVGDLVEACGRFRYAPDPPDLAERAQMLRRGRELLERVDREAVSNGRLRRTTSGGLALQGLIAPLLVLLTVGTPTSQTDRETTGLAGRWFAEGVTAYGQGEYTTAVERFERALAERPDDPNLLYNLGNAYYEAGDRGRAVWAWVRTLRLRPRDSDARFNLRLAIGQDPVVASALPPVPLSGDELALLFTCLWLAGLGALLARRSWRNGYLAAAAAAGLTGAVVVAGLALAPRSDYGIVVDPGATVRAGPVSQAEVLARPAPGTGYRIVESRDDWFRVARGGASEGWMTAGGLARLD